VTVALDVVKIERTDGPNSWLDGVGGGVGWRNAVPSLSGNRCIANHMTQKDGRGSPTHPSGLFHKP